MDFCIRFFILINISRRIGNFKIFFFLRLTIMIAFRLAITSNFILYNGYKFFCSFTNIMGFWFAIIS